MPAAAPTAAPQAPARPIRPGDRVRHGGRVGLVLHQAGARARVAFEGRLPEELQVDDLERVTARDERVITNG